MKKFLTLSILGAALSSAPAWGALLVFDDLASFQSSAVVGGTFTATELFNAGGSSLFTFTNNPGFSQYIDPLPTDGDYVRESRLVNGVYSEVITPIAGAAVSGGTLNGPLTAWGANINVAVGGVGQGVNLIVNFVGGTTQTITNVNLREGSPDGVFYIGVTVDGATPLISSITLQASNQNAPDASGELFQIDNISVKGAVNGGGGGGVPEPSTFGLMGLAMVGLGFVRRLRA